MVKVCTKCKVEKPFDEFGKRKTAKDGLRYECKFCEKTRAKAWRKANKDKIKSYYESNKDKIKAKKKIYRESNKDKIKAKKKIYYQVNKDKINTYEREKRKTDGLYKMKRYLRNRTYKAFIRQGYNKNTKTQEMLGIDWETAKQHIERQFKRGMSWDNYGEWHIDHIIPLASANTPERIKKLCHYTNLQPMWAEDNLSKRDIINGQQTLLRI